MRIGLIDVDGHNFPNLALMKISAYHKSKGDEVEWWQGDLFHYDIIYKSKVFSDTYTKDTEDPINCDRLVKGGSGYAIMLVDGAEVYDKSLDPDLPEEIERMFPDYSIYPQYDFAVQMTTRGCPRGCKFCIVARKEGQCSKKVADVKDFYAGQKTIEVLDPNILASKEHHEIFRQLIGTNAYINFNQGLDIRLITEQDIDELNQMRIKRVHFAWDNPKDDLADRFKFFADRYKRKSHAGKVVYVLTNFNSTMDENLHRIYTLRDLGYDPYVMIYDKPNAPAEVKRLARWVNNRRIFRSCDKFEDYVGGKNG